MAKASDYADTLRADIEEHTKKVRSLEVELASARAVLAALTSALARAEDKTDPTVKKRAPRSSVKTTVLALLEQVGENGLNAGMVVEMARNHQIELDRGSVSSLLSRLKHDGAVTHEGDRYRLSKFSTSAEGEASADNVRVHPASGRSIFS